MKEFYKFADIMHILEKKHHNYVCSAYHRAIKLFDSGIINENIRELIVFKNGVRLIPQKKVKKFINFITEIKNKKHYIPKQAKSKKIDTWNDDSIYCYSIGCNCQECNIAKLYPVLYDECQMNKVVLRLFKKLGAPNQKPPKG